jgi:simple sugar transport system ATP-binding protein
MLEQLQIKNLTKRFGTVIANDRVTFDVRRGEIHCLFGENGAGKSTLAECIYGTYRPESGAICFNGELVEFNSPRDAIQLGIGMIHQHFVLVPPLTVLENIIVGTEDAKVLLNTQKAENKFKELCARYELKLNSHAAIWDLSVGEQQWVEILKALYLDVKFLILDEPTAVLTPEESDKLFRILNVMKRQGISIVLITHKLKEVMQSDRVTVMRKGKIVNTVDTKSTTREQLTHMMISSEIAVQGLKKQINSESTVVQIKKLDVRGPRGGYAVKDLNLTLNSHEIVGIAGVAGNGQKELFETLVGIQSPESGEVWLDTEDITHWSPAEILAAGVGHIPQDRYREGLIGQLSIVDNLLLGMHRSPRFAQRGFLDQERVRAFVQEQVDQFEIVAPSIDTVVGNLSGGNAQKVVLARELFQASVVLLANQPTRGLDISIADYVHRQLLEKRKEGYAILLASEELDELIKLSDRIVVMFKGQIAGEFDAENPDLEQIGLLMAGGNL